MFNQLDLNMPTIIGAIIVFAVFTAVAYYLYKEHKHNKSCGGGCSYCPNSANCHPK